MLTDAEAGQRLALRASPHQDDFEFVSLPALPDIPGQIAPAEQRYLYWLARDTYTGAGSVVEVGSWLGNSSAHLAAGLRDGGIGGALFCLDRFRWDAKQEVAQELQVGDDTTGLFQRNVLPVYPHVVALKTEIKKLRWDGGPVEILFLDAPKARGPFLHILRELGPSLIPGKSLVASQDFGLATAYAQALCFALLENELELVHVTGNTAGFLLRNELPGRKELKKRLDLEALGAERSIELWERMMARIERDDLKRNLQPGLCLHLYSIGERELACRRIRELEFTGWMLTKWRVWAARPEMYEKYSGLYDALGVSPDRT